MKTLPPEAQAKMEELALDYMTNHGTLPIEKCDEQERQSFSVGFIAGHAFARGEERERTTLILRAIKEEHPDCECEVYDSEAAVICVSCIIEPYLKESDS